MIDILVRNMWEILFIVSKMFILRLNYALKFIPKVVLKIIVPASSRNSLE